MAAIFNAIKNDDVKIAAAFLVLFLSLLGESAFSTEYSHEMFSLDVPQGWVVIPIDVVNKRLREDGSPEGLFQLSLTTSKKLQDYIDGNEVDRLPVVNIQDSPVGYLSESECRKSLEEAENASVGFSSGTYGPLMRSRVVVFLVSITDGPLAGLNIEIILKVVCIDSGVIMIHTNNYADDDTYNSDIDQILQSFIVADHYQWKQRDSNVDRIAKAGKRRFQSALGLGLIGSILGLVVYFSFRGSKHRKKRE